MKPVFTTLGPLFLSRRFEGGRRPAVRPLWVHGVEVKSRIHKSQTGSTITLRSMDPVKTLDPIGVTTRLRRRWVVIHTVRLRVLVEPFTPHAECLTVCLSLTSSQTEASRLSTPGHETSHTTCATWTSSTKDSMGVPLYIIHTCY